MKELTETFSVLVENKFGVLTRVAGLFSARGYNIDSLTVSHTETPDYSRMTIVTHGDSDILEQIEKQLTKLIEVVQVQRLTQGHFIVGELMLVKVGYHTQQDRSDLLAKAASFEAQVLADSDNAAVFRLTATTERLNDFIAQLAPCSILELARTGCVALS